jgi:hypothetical protein
MLYQQLWLYTIHRRLNKDDDISMIFTRVIKIAFVEKGEPHF